MAKEKGDAEAGKVCAILVYLLIGIIWYFVDEKMKKNKFANYHVKQGLVLIITSLLGNAILGVFPIFGWSLIPFFQLLILVLMIIGIINAANSKQKELPIIGQFAKKFNF